MSSCITEAVQAFIVVSIATIVGTKLLCGARVFSRSIIDFHETKNKSFGSSTGSANQSHAANGHAQYPSVSQKEGPAQADFSGSKDHSRYFAALALGLMNGTFEIDEWAGSKQRLNESRTNLARLRYVVSPGIRDAVYSKNLQKCLAGTSVFFIGTSFMRVKYMSMIKLLFGDALAPEQKLKYGWQSRSPIPEERKNWEWGAHTRNRIPQCMPRDGCDGGELIKLCGMPGRDSVRINDVTLYFQFKTFWDTPEADQLFMDDIRQRAPRIIVFELGQWGTRRSKHLMTKKPASQRGCRSRLDYGIKDFLLSLRLAAPNAHILWLDPFSSGCHAPFPRRCSLEKASDDDKLIFGMIECSGDSKMRTIPFCGPYRKSHPEGVGCPECAHLSGPCCWQVSDTLGITQVPYLNAIHRGREFVDESYPLLQAVNDLPQLRLNSQNGSRLVMIGHGFSGQLIDGLMHAVSTLMCAVTRWKP